MNFMYGLICTVAVMLSVCFIRSAPPSPPSYAAAAKKEDISHSYQHIFNHRIYSLDLISLTMSTILILYISDWCIVGIYHNIGNFVRTLSLYSQ